jgi:ferredoxin-nitrite reductase
MWLIEEKTLPVFVESVKAKMSEFKGKDYAFEPEQPRTSEWTLGHRDVLGVHPQKQEGHSWVGVHVPVGRLSADECVEIADVADKYSNGEIRFTVEQNVIFPNVANDKIDALLKEPIFTKPGSRLNPHPSNIIGHLVSCTGAQFCPVAIVETKIPVEAVIRKLETLVEAPKPVRIHATGCPNSCGQVQVADIGLMGAPAKKADATGALKAVPGVNIFVGGSIGEHAHLQMEPSVKGIPLTVDDLAPVLAKIIVDNFGGKYKA